MPDQPASEVKEIVVGATKLAQGLTLEPGAAYRITLLEPTQVAVLSVEDSALANTATDAFVELLAAFFGYRKAHADVVVCLASHYDGASPCEANSVIALERARVLYHFLAGKDEDWRRQCLEHAMWFDYPQVFAWLDQRCGIPCDPGRSSDSSAEAKLCWSREQLRLAQDGPVEACDSAALTFTDSDWKVLASSYLTRIADRLGLTLAELQALRAATVFSDPPILVCAAGEHPHPLRGAGGDRSRVDVLFFQAGRVPPLRVEPVGSSIYGVQELVPVDTPAAGPGPSSEPPAAPADEPEGFLYTVKSGDYLVKLATQFGLASWQDIYHHPRNQGYRTSHPNPDNIYVGDQVWIPAPARASANPPDHEGHPLVYSYALARANGVSESLRSRRPAVGYAQHRLNTFLQNYDRAANDEAYPYDPASTRAYRDLVPAQLEVDEVFGEDTENAVKALQSSKGIAVDGKIGPVTWDWLEFQVRQSSTLRPVAPSVAPIAGFFGFPWLAAAPLPVSAIAFNAGGGFFPAASPLDLTPYDAVDGFYLYGKEFLWGIGCSWFVQIAHLFALAMTLGRDAFNARVGTPFLFRSHQSSGMVTLVFYSRDDPNDTKSSPMYTNGDRSKPDPRPADVILADAPEGCRVCFHNPDKLNDVWTNENAIKLGPDRFAAHGGTRFQKNVYSQKELRKLMCQGAGTANPDAIFVTFIELYEYPVVSEYLDALEHAVARLKAYGFAYPVGALEGSYTFGYDQYDPAFWREVPSNYAPDPAWLRMRRTFDPTA